MKRFFALLSAVALALSLSANAFAFSSDFVVDNADLLSEGEESTLSTT